MKYHQIIIPIVCLVISFAAVEGAATLTKPAHVAKAMSVTTPSLINRKKRTISIIQHLEFEEELSLLTKKPKPLVKQFIGLYKKSILIKKSLGHRPKEFHEHSPEDLVEVMVTEIPCLQSHAFKSRSPRDKHLMFNVLRTTTEKIMAKEPKELPKKLTRTEIKKIKAEYRFS